jgi:hypothetical protein
LGNSVGSGPEEVPMGFWPEAAEVGVGEAPPALGDPCASFGLEVFRGVGAVLSA